MNYIQMRLIQIDCEFTKFAFNVLSHSHSCGQSLRDPGLPMTTHQNVISSLALTMGSVYRRLVEECH